MEPIEAYNLIILKVQELQNTGIEVSIVPKYENTEHDKFYHKPFGVPPSKWVYVYFNNPSTIQRDNILQARKQLYKQGITFKDFDINKSDIKWKIDSSIEIFQPGTFYF